MLLLSLSGGQSPIGRIDVSSSALNRLPIGHGKSRGERLAEILAWDGTESLFEELVDKYIYRAGISGVQPKVLVPERMGRDWSASRATVLTQDLIVKSGRSEYPGLAANEFLCMSMAREAGISVPEFFLSKNKELFIMRRFDRTADGSPLCFEDMAVLAGRPSVDKYSSNYTHIAKLVEVFASSQEVSSSLRQLFDIVALSCIVGNGDAHLKNLGLLYIDPTSEDCRLAPAFNIVNTTAYIPEDVMALDLCGQKSFFAARQGLPAFARTCRVDDCYDRMQRLLLVAEFVLNCEVDVAESIPHVVGIPWTCFRRFLSGRRAFVRSVDPDRVIGVAVSVEIFIGLFRAVAFRKADLAIKRFDLALQLDQERIALAVQRLAGGYLDPALADAIFRDVQTLLVVQSDTHIVFEYGGNVIGTARVDRQMVGQRGKWRGLVHGCRFSMI